MKFPRILAAWRQIELDQWELGDALIEECGEPEPQSRRDNGKFEGTGLKEAAEFLEKYGFDHGPSYLGKLRQTAFDFPPNKRRSTISWSTHNEAGTPETLKAVIDKLGDSKPTRDEVRETRRVLEGKPKMPKIQAVEPVDQYEGTLGEMALSFKAQLNTHDLRDSMKFVDQHIDELSEITLGAIIETAFEVSGELQAFAGRLQKRCKKASHLAVVSNG